jgi:putative membrane protein
MNSTSYILALAACLTLISCKESGRGNDSNVNEDSNEAAAESNTDKFAGKRQKDADFVYEVVAANYGEIKLAELANQRSRTEQVKNMALALEKDHTACLNELKTLAQAKAIAVPVEEKDAAKRRMENIAKESGADFDKEWCKVMMDMHEDNIDKFEKRLDDTEDAELKAFITKTLPVLQRHHESLKAYHEGIKEKNR